MSSVVKRETLADQVAAGLWGMIGGELQPGDRLPSTAALAEQFEVSRPVVREALQSLATQGVIHVQNGRGAFVRPVDATLLNLFFDRAIQRSVGSITELMEVRRPIEVQSARLAASRRSKDQLKQLKKVLKSMRKHCHDIEAYTNLDVSFHLLIAEASGNAMMNFLVGSIRGALHDAISEGLDRRRSTAELDRVQELHEGIFERIAEGDSDGAAEVMARHFDEAVTALVAQSE